MNGRIPHHSILWAAALLMLSMAVACSTATQATVPTVTAIPSTPTPLATATPTSTPTPEATATAEIKQFQVCKPENFRDCQVSVDDLFNGTYFRWLQTLSKPFDPSKVGELTFRVLSLPGRGNVIIPNIYDKPKGLNFGDSTTIPWRKGVTFAETKFEVNGVKYPVIMMPTEYFDKNDPTNNKWVLTILSDIVFGPRYSQAEIEKGLDRYVAIWRKMDVTPILTNTIWPGTSSDDPLAKRTYDNYPDMQDRFRRFEAGDLSALSQPGIVLLTDFDPYNVYRHH